MEHDVTPFWADIKKYEETLVNDPGSYCFVPLAELYRRMGLLDDAIHVAKKGSELHPDYVGGYMALGRAYFDKGMKAESRDALEKVIGFTPDNLLAHRLLGQIYVENGETAAAEESLRYILSQNPADSECLMLLDSLKETRPCAAAEGSAHADTHAFDFTLDTMSAEDDEIIEDAEILDDFDDDQFSDADFQPVGPDEGMPVPELRIPAEAPVEYDDFFFTPPDEAFTAPEESFAPESPAEESVATLPVSGEAFTEPEEEIAAEESDPLITATMAELYVSQGFLKRALTIYRELLEADPENEEWKNRLYDLKTAIDEDTAIARHEVAEEGGAEAETVVVPDRQEVPAPVAVMIEPAASGDAVVVTLETWLDNVRRRR